MIKNCCLVNIVLGNISTYKGLARVHMQRNNNQHCNIRKEKRSAYVVICLRLNILRSSVWFRSLFSLSNQVFLYSMKKNYKYCEQCLKFAVILHEKAADWIIASKSMKTSPENRILHFKQKSFIGQAKARLIELTYLLEI